MGAEVNQLRGKLSVLSLTLHMGCGGIVERNPPGITALCVTECVLFTDGHRACVTLTDPKQLEEPWWWDVERVESSEACKVEWTPSTP